LRKPYHISPKKAIRAPSSKKIFAEIKKYLDKKKREEYNISVEKPYSDYGSESL